MNFFIFVKVIAYNFIVLIKQCMPERFQEIISDLFFKYFAISIIKTLTIEYSGYLKYYSPQKGDVIVDAGAWKGHFSIIASRLVGNKGKVIAIEPQKEMFNKLRCRFNRLRIKNISVINRGLYDKNISRKVEKRTLSSFSVNSTKAAVEGKTETIILATLSTVLNEVDVSSIDFIKMDIEGAEIEAISGMIDILESNNVNLAIATYHKREGEKTYLKVEQILNEIGYKTITAFPSHLTTYAWKQSI